MKDTLQEPVEGEYSPPNKAAGINETRDFAKGFWSTAHLREKAIIVIGIIYALSPIDLIPEILLGPLGLLDDGGALFVVLLTITSVLKRQRSTQDQIKRQ